MKKVFSLLLCGILVISLVSGCGCNKKEDEQNNEVNESTNTKIKDTIVEGLDIIDFVVIFENNISEVYYTVENNKDEAITFNQIECIMYDKSDKIIYSFVKELGTIEPGDSIDISGKFDINLTKVAKVEYSLK